MNKRLKIFINYFLGPLLFIGLSISIYRNIIHQQHWQRSLQQIKKSLTGEQAWKPAMVIFLMFANWGFEALKWQVLIRHIQQISFIRAFKAILSGLSVSLAMNTPNGIGEYFGRILYVREGNRLRAITLTFVGSISQLIITMLLGSAGLFMLRTNFYNAANQTIQLSFTLIDFIAYGSVAVTIILIIIYLNSAG